MRINFRKNRSPKIERDNIISHYEQAINWIKDNTISEQGVVVTSKQRYPYLEVTGYLIPTLIDSGEYKLAKRYSEFLCYMQRPNGSFAGPDGKEYIFDSGQALRGLLQASLHWEEYKPYAIKTADYLVSSINEDGRIPSSYGEDISEYVHVFILPALMDASKLFDMQKYRDIADLSINYYKKIPDILDPQLTHFQAYIIDGFIDAGEKEFVQKTVKDIFSRQKANGSISAYPDVGWVCSTGLAQLAIIAYKLKMYNEGDKAIKYLCNIQNSTGGFYGSYGNKANYFPHEEISWTNKFFIDAIHMKIESFFNSNSNIFPAEISQEDGRLKELFTYFGDLNNKRILDAGCGKGRFSKNIKEKYPNSEVNGVDISEELLKEVPGSIITRKGNILNLPYEDESFDAVFCIEALEHTIRQDKAIEELCRVLKIDGKIVIIDKNIKKIGRMQITDFEQWFDENSVSDQLKEFCNNVSVRPIDYDNHISDGLFLFWSGIKGPVTIDENQWHDVMVKNNRADDLVKRINNNQFPPWIKPLIQHTSPGDKILELGSGTGFLSSILGVYGRKPYLLDYSSENINFNKELFNMLNIEGRFFCGNVLDGIPIDNKAVDWVWSSGLLEHFTNDQIQHIMNESARVSKKGVISLVPNANSTLYRIGKHRMELSGKWLYGREDPKYSMKNYFQEAGLVNIKEFSIGTYHVMEFMDSIRADTKAFFDSLDIEELQNMNQGYLLFTYGEKK